MERFILCLLIAIISISSYSQGDQGRFQNKNSLQVDLDGPGIFYSLNYERVLLNGEKFKTTSQVGVSYYPPQTGMRDIWIPIGINELISYGNHHLEVGIGYMPIREALRDPELQVREWIWSHTATGRLGYRYQKNDGHLILRVAFTPVLEIDPLNHGGEFHPLGGVSIGYSF